MRIFGILLGGVLLLSAFSAQAGSLNHRFDISKGDSSLPSFNLSSPNRVHVSYQWLSLEKLPSSVKAAFLENPDMDSKSIVFMVRSNFLLSQPMEIFSANFFKDHKLLGTMSGMKHKATHLDNVFGVKYKPVPWVTIRSTAEISFPDALPTQGLFMNQEEAQQLVDLSYFDFSEYLNQMNSLWSFSEYQGYTRVEMISIAVLKLTKMKGLKWEAVKDSMERSLQVQIQETVKVLED